MATRQIRTQELVQLATEHSGLSSAEAGDVVRVVVDTITERGTEGQIVEFVTEGSLSEGVAVKRALDPADPPKLDLQRAAIADEGMIGRKLFRSRS